MNTFSFDDPPTDPLVWLRAWIDEAAATECREPAAMALATVDAQGRPSNRIVLFKGLIDGAPVFYTNYESRKGGELPAGAPVALCFWWDSLYRQLRIEGQAERLPPAQSDAYFASRPRGSQLGAWASAQSREVADRDALQTAYAQAQARFGDGPVPRPPHWGGYRVRPSRIEFWQGCADRMHDRREYRLGPVNTWVSARLQP